MTTRIHEMIVVELQKIKNIQIIKGVMILWGKNEKK